MATGRLIPIEKHNLFWIVDKDGNIIGAIRHNAYFSLLDVRRSEHLCHLYHEYVTAKFNRENKKE